MIDEIVSSLVTVVVLALVVGFWALIIAALFKYLRGGR